MKMELVHVEEEIRGALISQRMNLKALADVAGCKHHELVRIIDDMVERGAFED